MRNILFLGVTVAAVIVFARLIRKWEGEDATMEELDQVLREILGDCLEAYCEDCDGILAQGTGQYKEDVFTVAFNHGEIYDHEVKVRSWADLWAGRLSGTSKENIAKNTEFQVHGGSLTVPLQD